MSINHAKKQYLDGVRSGVPVILGFIPVGIAYAVMARQTGLTVFETILMSICVFAGASQMMVVGMYAQDASIAAMVLAVLLQSFKST
ncbi:AzlC family ABC transporter permease, partial [Enterococcus faecium]